MGYREKKKMRIWAAAATVLALVVFLAGCGGRSEAPAAGGPASSGGTAAGGQEQVKSGAGKGSATGESLTLKVADSLPVKHWGSARLAVPWMKRVEELTGGRVRFEYYPAEQLGKLNDMLNMVRTGVADIVYILPPQFPAELPLNGMVTLPGLFETAREGSALYAAMLKQGPLLDEFRALGVQPLFSAVAPTYEVYTVKKPVRLPTDIKGLKIRIAGGAQAAAAEAVGALPVSVPTPDQYTALQRGTVDGTFYYHSGLKDYKLEEVVRFATDGAALTSADLAYVINESLWKRLDPAVQEAMRQAAEEVMPQVAAYLDEDTRTSVQQYEAKGIQILRLTDADKKAWQDALQPVRDKWVKDMEAKGRPGGQVLAAWAEARQRAGR